MIVQLNSTTTQAQQQKIFDQLQHVGYKYQMVTTQLGNYLVCIGKNTFDPRRIGNLPGVADIHIVHADYQLVSAEWKVKPTEIDLGHGVSIGGPQFALMAGPCSIESEEQIVAVANHLKDNNVGIMRGGVFKPRSSPYSFRGHGLDMLKKWQDIVKPLGIKIITEVMHPNQVEDMYPYTDIYQVGARNTQNFNLLDALGQVDKPVMIKRGISGTIDELLYSAEYVFSGGNERIILCERGIRTYEKATRNTLDLNAIPVLKDKTHLPVVVDPSHGIGIRAYVAPMSLAAVMAGADGIIVEIHPQPEKAASDGQQTLDFDESAKLFKQLRQTLNLRRSL